jgi:predicted transcriptional regulator
MERPDIYVITRFLESLWMKGKGQMRRTELQMSVQVNYNIFLKYLDFLVAKGLITEVEENGERLVRITEKGVSAYNMLVGLVKMVFEK